MRASHLNWALGAINVSQDLQGIYLMKNELKNPFLLVASGIVIPIIAVLIPYLISFFTQSSGLTYNYKGIVEVNDTKAFEVTINNDGNLAEKNVEIWLTDELPSEGVEIESDVDFVVRTEQGKSVVSIGNVRSGETLRLAFLIDEPLFFMHDYQIQELKVRSEHRVAKFAGLSDGWLLAYKAGFWGAIALFISMICLGIYQEYFMPKSEREKMLLKEMEKL